MGLRESEVKGVDRCFGCKGGNCYSSSNRGSNKEWLGSDREHKACMVVGLLNYYDANKERKTCTNSV